MRTADIVRVLLVEDDEDDYLITSEMLVGQGRTQFAVDWCSEYGAALEMIGEQRHDVYLIDYRLGERTGLELVREAFADGRSAPVIMLTGHATYEIDLEATALGVTDFLVKQHLDRAELERSIRYAISHQKAERYALAVRAASDGIWDWDLERDQIYLSPRWHAILGLPAEPRDDSPAAWFDLVAPEDLPRLRAAITAHLERREPHLECEYRVRHADGEWRWVMTRGLAIRSADGTPTRIAGSLSDMTDRRIAQLRLEHDALHDTLTGLPNRTLFTDRVNQVEQRSSREPALGCAILFLDLDGFKLVNDSLSHAVGDHLLIALAERVVATVRPGDTVARLGGDEFTVLLDGLDDPLEATFIAERILRALDEPFDIDGNELFVTASIGISLSAPGLGSAELIRRADIAMYDAKRRGRARCAVFDARMHRRVTDRLVLRRELRQAVESSLLRVHYQPIIELATGHIVGFEALARWPEAWSSVSPTEFISIAEETGVIGALGHHVMSTAVRALARWREDDIVSDETTLSVNLSGRQLDDPGLPEQVRSAIRGSGVPASALKLEITESTLMELERSGELLAELRNIGLGLHLDDFGTGYSSLTSLYRFPIEALKIDRSFVSAMSEEEDEVIARSATALAHSLGVPVIAEGVESPQQLHRLRLLGCEYGQGDLISPALSEGATRALLETWRPAEVVDLGAATQ
jgi:diguanylate cyclase (GGDEF)-like protein/PAS domain S-box-containing protein